MDTDETETPREIDLSQFPMRIEVRPLLTCGGMGFGPQSVFIVLADNLTKTEAVDTLWHEVVHLLMCLGGHRVHDEKLVEQIAGRLAAAVPEVLDLCGLESRFK